MQSHALLALLLLLLLSGGASADSVLAQEQDPDLENVVPEVIIPLDSYQLSQLDVKSNETQPCQGSEPSILDVGADNSEPALGVTRRAMRTSDLVHAVMPAASHTKSDLGTRLLYTAFRRFFRHPQSSLRFRSKRSNIWDIVFKRPPSPLKKDFSSNVAVPTHTTPLPSDVTPHRVESFTLPTPPNRIIFRAEDEPIIPLHQTTTTSSWQLRTEHIKVTTTHQTERPEIVSTLQTERPATSNPDRQSQPRITAEWVLVPTAQQQHQQHQQQHSGATPIRVPGCLKFLCLLLVAHLVT